MLPACQCCTFEGEGSCLQPRFRIVVTVRHSTLAAGILPFLTHAVEALVWIASEDNNTHYSHVGYVYDNDNAASISLETHPSIFHLIGTAPQGISSHRLHSLVCRQNASL